MARNIDYDELCSRLKAHLVVVGPTTAKDIGQALAISQPTVSRLVKYSSQAVLVIGSGRAARYVGKRETPLIGEILPVYAIDESGNASHCATLRPTLPQGYYVESLSEDIDSRLHGDLPYFLNELRPTGFLGRLAPQRHPELQLPQDIKNWTADQCLVYLTRHGWNVTGNLIVGEEALERYLRSTSSVPSAISLDGRAMRYLELAENSLAAAQPGSSAAGEQPKFLATLDPERHVLVKFSPRLDGSVAERVADLLVVEHLTHQVLRNHGVSSPQSELIITDERVFLEVERFDRLIGGGRRGVISYLAIDSEYVGALRTWSDSARALVEQKRIEPDTATRILWLELYGRLIANTDMHFENLSYLAKGERLQGLAPIYDMLPMFYMPQHGNIHSEPWTIPMPVPIYGPIWRSAYAAALELWTVVSEDVRISEGFRQIASSNLAELERWRTVAEKLPQ